MDPVIEHRNRREVGWAPSPIMVLNRALLSFPLRSAGFGSSGVGVGQETREMRLASSFCRSSELSSLTVSMSVM